MIQQQHIMKYLSSYVRHFLSEKFGQFLKNNNSSVENECWCLCTITITNQMLTLQTKISMPREPENIRHKMSASGSSNSRAFSMNLKVVGQNPSLGKTFSTWNTLNVLPLAYWKLILLPKHNQHLTHWGRVTYILGCPVVDHLTIYNSNRQHWKTVWTKTNLLA